MCFSLMKQIYTVLVSLFFSAFSMGLCAQTQVVVLSDTAEHNLGSAATKEFKLSLPCNRVVVQAKHSPNSNGTDAVGTLYFDEYVDGKWNTIYQGNPGIVTTAEKTVLLAKVTYEASVAYENLTLEIDKRATKIRFKTDVASLLQNKQIKNLNCYMASFVETSPRTIDMGEMVVWSEPVSKQFVVEHCNVAKLTIASDNKDFAPSAATVANSGIGVYRKDTFTVTFTPSIKGEHRATLIVTNGVYTDSVMVRAKVTKRNPVITLAQNELTVGDTIEVSVSSDCTNRLMIETCQSDLLEVKCGALIARAAGTATIEVMQLGDDDYWNNKVAEFEITIQPAMEPTGISNATNASAAKRYIRNGQVMIAADKNDYYINGQKK